MWKRARIKYYLCYSIRDFPEKITVCWVLNIKFFWIFNTWYITVLIKYSEKRPSLELNTRSLWIALKEFYHLSYENDFQLSIFHTHVLVRWTCCMFYFRIVRSWRLFHLVFHFQPYQYIWVKGTEINIALVAWKKEHLAGYSKVIRAQFLAYSLSYFYPSLATWYRVLNIQ